MIKKESIRPGVILRTLSNHLGTPRNAIATVETVETSRMGDWFCTLRYDNKRITKRRYPYRSHLWECELGCVEIVTDLNEIVERPSRRSRSPFEPVIPKSQVELPFNEEEALYISRRVTL